MEYHTITSAMTIKPVGDPIFSERATTVGIDDESGGPYVVIAQPTGPTGDNRIAITADEWPSLRDAVEAMLATCADEDRRAADHGRD